MQKKCFGLLLSLGISVMASNAQSTTTKAEEIKLKGVVVTGKQRASLTASSLVLRNQNIQENKGKVLADVLSDMAGVSTISMGNTIVKPVINGLHSNRILLLNNGIRHEGQQWGAEHAPELDPFSADRMEVVKGAQGVRYGADALAGVVLLSPRPIETENPITGNIDLIGQSNGRGLTMNGRLEGGIKKIPHLGWRIQASGKKVGNYKSADYYLGNTGARELNFSGSLNYRFKTNEVEVYYSHFGTELGIFAGAHIGTVEDILPRIAHGRPFETYDFTYAIAAPRQRVDHDLAKFRWRRQLSDSNSLELLYGFQRNHRREYDKRRIESDDTPMADMILTTQNVEAVLKISDMALGVQANIQVNNNQSGTGTTPIIPNFDNFNIGAFATRQFSLGNVLAEFGGRYDFKHLDAAGYRYDYKNQLENGVVNQYLMTDQRRFHNVSGTAGILYPVSEKLTWKSNLGLAWRAPSANELYSDGVHHGSGTYEVGDKSLKSEKGLKWANSLLWNTQALQVTLDIYGQLVYDYIYAQPNPDSVRQTIRGTFPLFAYAQHDAFFYGADLSLDYQFSPALSYQVNGSLVRAKNIDANTYLPYIPADRIRHGLQWNFPLGALPVNYLKVMHRFVAKQDRYEVGSDYATPPPAYHLVDAMVSTNVPLTNRKNINILLRVDNLLNTEYKDYMDRFRYYAHQMGRNINLRISYQF
ncbi:TonB-dependent receptor [Sphingobacterium psychroaquaticum]|nr:TonB-dependent receptor [Sphingobacterium psychroaquaticum]